MLYIQISCCALASLLLICIYNTGLSDNIFLLKSAWGRGCKKIRSQRLMNACCSNNSKFKARCSIFIRQLIFYENRSTSSLPILPIFFSIYFVISSMSSGSAGLNRSSSSSSMPLNRSVFEGLPKMSSSVSDFVLKICGAN